jgi:hypothetical protein
MPVISPPPGDSVDSQDSIGAIVAPREGWRNFFQSAYIICQSVTSSGTTANRPVALLWTGRTYFDTTMSIPIWYDGAVWIDATGTPV